MEIKCDIVQASPSRNVLLGAAPDSSNYAMAPADMGAPCTWIQEVEDPPELVPPINSDFFFNLLNTQLMGCSCKVCVRSRPLLREGGGEFGPRRERKRANFSLTLASEVLVCARERESKKKQMCVCVCVVVKGNYLMEQGKES